MKKQPLMILITSILLLFSQQASAFKTQEHSLLTTLKQHFAYVGQLKTLAVEATGQRQTKFQSNNFQQPYTIQSRYQHQYDLTQQQFYYHQQHVYPGNFIFDDKIVHQQNKTILYDANGFTMGKQLQFLDYDLAEFKQDLAEDIDVLAAFQFLAKANNSNTEIDKKPTSADLTHSAENEEKVTYHFALNPIRLISITYLDADKKTEFSQPVEKMGISYASSVRHYRKGELKNTLTITKVQQIPAIKPALLEVPQGYGPFVDDQEKPLQWAQIAEDLYLINYVGGNRHIVVQANKQGLTVFGAPISSKISEKVTALINKHLPDHSIDSVYITHGHSDHMGGLSHYANLGVKIIADSFTIAAIKAYPRFKDDVSNWQFQAITHRKKLNKAIYYVPKNSHSDGQSFVYFQNHKIIYQGDFLEIPFDNSLPTHMADVEKEFIEFLLQEKLPYTRIIGHHRNNNMTPEVVNAYYRAHHRLPAKQG